MFSQNLSVNLLAMTQSSGNVLEGLGKPSPNDLAASGPFP